MARTTFTRPSCIARIARIEAALRERPMNVSSLAKAIFTSEAQTQQYVLHLHAARRVHISGWHLHMAKNRNVGHLSALYAVGDAPDAPLDLPNVKEVS